MLSMHTSPPLLRSHFRLTFLPLPLTSLPIPSPLIPLTSLHAHIVLTFRTPSIVLPLPGSIHLTSLAAPLCSYLYGCLISYPSTWLLSSYISVCSLYSYLTFSLTFLPISSYFWLSLILLPILLSSLLLPLWLSQNLPL